MAKKVSITLAAGLIGLAALLYGWLLPPSSPACAVFTGGPILTMDDAAPAPEAVQIRDGRIQAVGALADIDESGCQRIDLAGRTLMPGLIEPHTHPIASAMLSQTLDVSGFTHSSRASIMAALREAASSGSGPIMAFGWDPVIIADLDPPTLAELDEIAPDRPLMILTQMMHDAYANSAAFKAAGITADTPNPEGAEFVRDENGNLTGTVREVNAITALMAASPKAPEGAFDLLLNLQYAAYAKAGYTTVGALGPSGNTQNPVGMMRRLANFGTPPVRMVVYALPGQIADENLQPGTTNTARTFTLRGVKFWMDGSPYAGGAAFAEPYEDTPLTRERLHLHPPHTGKMNYSPQDFEAAFLRFHEQGYHIAIHVQGELAIDRALDAAEKALAAHPWPDHRHRLEHNALITPAQMKRAQALGLTLSFFVDHIYFYGTRLPELVGTRTQRYMPLGTAIRAGHRVTFHTDNPATPIGPFRAMRTAITRLPQGSDTPINMENALSREDALKALTTNAAWQLGLEDEVGSLTPGKLADLVILNDNPATIAAENLTDIEVQETWIGGKKVDTRPATLTNAKLVLNVLRNLIF